MNRMRKIRKIHFVGIGGVGMSGIAEVLLNEGYLISGSDLSENEMTDHLGRLGVKIYKGHQEDFVKGSDVVVISSAIKPDNTEFIAANKYHIPVVPRAEMLAELMRFRSGIAVSGTHGKTTTTSLIANILKDADMDPTFVIGGRLNSANTNAQLGLGKYLVAEADESDASFLNLQPLISVVTNIDCDHMETYNHDYEELKEGFIKFLHRLPFYGLAVLCLDDLGVKEIMPHVSRPIITYGFDENADVKALNFYQIGTKTYFDVIRKGHSDLSIHLNLAGKHNVLNALAAVCIATELDISDEIICKSFENFSGVGRRFQQLGDYNFNRGKALFIDDYGHHPHEVEVTIEAARCSWPDKRLVMVFQPHRYTRTRDLFSEFVRVLSKVDVLLLLDIYSAGDKPIAGVSSSILYQNIVANSGIEAFFVSKKEELANILNRVLMDQDIVLMQGAGDITNMAKDLMRSEKMNETIY